jgi:hypothetical protein
MELSPGPGQAPILLNGIIALVSKVKLLLKMNIAGLSINN